MTLRYGRLATGVLTMAILTIAACSDGRVPCYPVRGKVLVNNKPAKDLLVVFNPKNEGKERLAPSAMTNENGEFEVSTQERNGAPAGEYSVTFTWREASGLLKNQFDGPDRLKGRYADPKQNQFPLTIESRSMELPPFQLATK